MADGPGTASIFYVKVGTIYPKICKFATTASDYENLQRPPQKKLQGGGTSIPNNSGKKKDNSDFKKMPNPENIRGHEFKPGQSGNPKGRPRNKAYEDIKAVFGQKTLNELKSLSAGDTKDWDALLLKMTVPQLQVLAKADTVAAYARATAMAILHDMKMGRTATIDKLNGRVNGEAAKKVELTGKDGADLIPARVLTQEEAAAFIGKLQQDY